MTGFTHFKAGRTSTDEDLENPRPGPPSTSISDNKIDKVRTMICEDHCLTVREIAEELGFSVGSKSAFQESFQNLKKCWEQCIALSLIHI